MKYAICYFILLCLCSPFPALAKRGGGSFGRGGSGARTNPSSNSNNHYHGGAASPAAAPARPAHYSNNGYNPNNGFNPNNGYNPKFHLPVGGIKQGGYGKVHQPDLKPKKSHTLKNAIIGGAVGGAVGAVAGGLIFEAGKAYIGSRSAPAGTFDDRNYYWGREYSPLSAGQIECTMPVEKFLEGRLGPNQTLPLFKDGDAPKEVVWACSSYERCCETKCCDRLRTVYVRDRPAVHPSSPDTARIVAVIIVFVLLACCCLWCCRRSSKDNSQNTTMEDDIDIHAPPPAYTQQETCKPVYYPTAGYQPLYPNQYPPNPTY
ncbi:unnamed protein product, partial [Mesorhabditis spiculigera]